MRCARCGTEIPEEMLYCPECGTEIQIVPDYNPLDDVLTREVRGSVEGATRQIRTDDIRKYRENTRPGSVNSTRVLSEDELGRIRNRRPQQAGSADSPRQNTTPDRKNPESTDRLRKNEAAQKHTEHIRKHPDDRRRQQQLKRREKAKRKRRNLLITLFVILALVAVGIFVVYQNSYTGVVKKGYRALQNDEYTAAEKYFNRAVSKDRSRPEAFTGLAAVYQEQNDLSGAESVFLNAISGQPTNAKLYEAAIQFYMETEQPGKISELLEDCKDTDVLSTVSDYISEAPKFSLEAGTYDEVKEITITSETGGTIYYTTDGSDPLQSGTKYTEPVLLDQEGKTEIRAVAVNEKEIPSVVSTAEYNIEFPIADAPAVNPPTGQYTEPRQITITVPDGYTAYYTTDGSTPSAENGILYTGPVDMPQNAQIIFSAVLVNNDNKKTTPVTTRNYITLSE